MKTNPTKLSLELTDWMPVQIWTLGSDEVEESKEPTEYRVCGLETGRDVTLSIAGPLDKRYWTIEESVGEKSTTWPGKFQSPEAALRSLESQLAVLQ